MPIWFQVNHHIFNSLEVSFQLVFHVMGNGVSLFNRQSLLNMNREIDKDMVS